MNFTEFTTQAWDEHANHPAAVAQRLATEGLGLVSQPTHVAALAHLVHHVFGEHLGRWDDGLAALQALAAHPAAAADAPAAQAVQRCQASRPSWRCRPPRRRRTTSFSTRSRWPRAAMRYGKSAGPSSQSSWRRSREHDRCGRDRIKSTQLTHQLGKNPRFRACSLTRS